MPKRARKPSLLKYISIDRERIRRNIEEGRDDPVIVIEFEDFPGVYQYAREVLINGPSRVVYRPNSPDSDDRFSTAWVETGADIDTT
jgi:hypothetical protein